MKRLSIVTVDSFFVAMPDRDAGAWSARATSVKQVRAKKAKAQRQLPAAREPAPAAARAPRPDAGL